MTSSTQPKQARRITATEAAVLVRSGDWTEYGATLCQPDVFDQALAARVAELQDVKIRGCLSLRPRAVLEAIWQRQPKGQVRARARRGHDLDRAPGFS